jgi:hypothetical protein
VSEVPGLTILETSQFAHNSSKREHARTWVEQRWSYEVYAHREGRFVIPAPRVRVEVSLEGAEAVAGELVAPPVEVLVQNPSELAGAGDWVAASSFSVTESFDRPLDQLSVGDVLVREVLLSATDTPAMLLPPVHFESVPGLAAYRSTPVLENSRNRGELGARRVESVSYVVESPGDYHLPPLTFFWWDTTVGTLRTIQLSAQQFSVSGRAVGDAAGRLRFLHGLLIIFVIAAAMLLARVCCKSLQRGLACMSRRALQLKARLWITVPRQLNPRP